MGVLFFSCSKKTTEAATEVEETTEMREERQGPRGDRPRGQRERINFDQLAAQLALSPEQEEQFVALNEDFQTKMQEMRDSGTDRMAMREQMRSMRDERSAELKKILTEEQFQQYEKIIAEQRGKRGGRRGGRE